MPEVVRGSRPSIDEPRRSRRNVHFGPESPPLSEHHSQVPLSPDRSREHPGLEREISDRSLTRRQTDKLEDRPAADAYYDSRAATKREFRRRASNLQDYYKQHPSLLPQLPFTFRHGWRRFKLGALIVLIFIDACVVPIVLYYTMKFAGHVEGWIIFAVVATIWGGPTYVEFAVRSWRLIKKEDFFRPLGTTSRWAFDFVHYTSTFSIAAITALLIIGSAPHIVWLRVLSIPGPALLLCLGVPILYVTTLAARGKPAPFRISSTPKGGKVLPAVLYVIEDVVAVNASAGRPYREALHARYEASPRFRKMIWNQSWFWGIPSVIIGIVLIVVICIHETPKDVGYGLGWGIPFVWAVIWAFISTWWARRDMHKETITWEMDQGIYPDEQKLQSLELTAESDADNEAKDSPVAASDDIRHTTSSTQRTPESEAETADATLPETKADEEVKRQTHEPVRGSKPPTSSETVGEAIKEREHEKAENIPLPETPLEKQGDKPVGMGL